jgi:ornithine cyclodeaminase/alanine dehydrogenase-like protein (mu-crystallin family)
MKVLDAQTVRQRLSYAACIPLVREAMIAFSGGQTGNCCARSFRWPTATCSGSCPALWRADGIFGAKLVSVWPENFAAGKPSHQGVVVLFDPVSGAPTGVVDAGAITAIRTAAASAVATEALARPDATRLTVLGYGEQAEGHIRAIAEVRPISDVRVWGRRSRSRGAFAERIDRRDRDRDQGRAQRRSRRRRRGHRLHLHQRRRADPAGPLDRARDAT